MLMNILKFAGSNLLQQWLARGVSPSPAAPPTLLRPNVEHMRLLAARFAILAGVIFLHLMLLAGGLLVALVALAARHDLTGHWQSTATFWTGLAVAFYATLVTVLTGRALAATPLHVQDLVVPEPVPETMELNFVSRFVQPVLLGVFEGLASPRRRARPAGWADRSAL